MAFNVRTEGRFENAEDKSNDFLSQTSKFFDLRHTIPGEPNIDYPIYGEVPITSFSCADKHEGYYADIESRCQAFRICTHTARQTNGFGFLCPNGTLFSQRNFVCDWYRNVRCEESENYYDKNRQNYVGNSHEMMEKVRHMIEYPMKTISKALEQNPKAQSVTAPRPKNKSQNVASTNTKQAFGVTPKTNQNSQTIQKVLDESNGGLLPPNIDSDVYVNSLGELSTDPNVKFDAKNARIIAQANNKKKNARNLNLAESINFGLNDISFEKNIRDTKNADFNLNSNLNLLKHELMANLPDAKIIGYQPKSAIPRERNFQYLSRGFSTQNNNNKVKVSPKNSYYYEQPKQTADTLRFNTNDLLTNDFNNLNNKNKTNDDDEVQFELMPPTTVRSTTLNSLQINAELFDLAGGLIFDVDEESEEHESNTTMETSVAITTSTTPTPTTTEPISTLATLLQAPPETFNDNVLLNSLDVADVVQILSDHSPSESITSDKSTEDKISVNRQAEELFLNGLHLVENNLDNSLATKAEESMNVTKTEMVTEVNVVETRVRSTHRRFNRTRATRTTTASTTTTPRPRLLKRLPKSNATDSSHIAKRHRRIQQRKILRTTTVATDAETHANELSLLADLPLNAANEGQPANRKILTRNINSKSSQTHNNKFNVELNKPLRYAKRKRTTTKAPTTTTTANNDTSTGKYKLSWTQAAMRDRQAIIRARGSLNYKTKSTVAKSTTNNNDVEEIIATQLIVTPLNVSLINAINSTHEPLFISNSSSSTTSTTSTTTTTLNPLTTFATTTKASIQDTQQQKDHNKFLPFEELTRSIVDHSFLQNYGQNKPQVQQQQLPLYLQLQTKSKTTTAAPISTHTFDNNKITAAGTYNTPNIFIARAEGRRLESTNAFRNLPIPQFPKEPVPYVPLNDFLNNKFGQNAPPSPTTTTTTKAQQNYYGTPQQQQNPFLRPQQPQNVLPVNPFLTQAQQQSQPTNFYAPKQQIKYTHTQQQAQPYNNINSYLNVKLPNLREGSIPSPYESQRSQRRQDTFAFNLDTTSSPRMNLFMGASSYDVPLKSVGRLPNDIQRKIKK